MADYRTLKLSILADVDDLKKNLNAGEKEVEGFGSKVADFGKKAALAFAAAAAAAAVYAGKLAIEGVKAAVEDEAAQESLRKTLENVTGATEAQTKAVEDYISQTSKQVGISDDELRPSLDRLLRATKDVTAAQDLQNLAIDIAAGSGKSLETVTNALAKAQEGQLGGLTRLGVGITAAEAKTMTFEEVVAKLGDTFEGQGEAKAATFQGRMEKLKISFDEAKESVGAALLPILDSLLSLITDKILPVIDKFTSSLSVDTGLGSNFTKIVNLIKTVATPVFEGLQSLFTKVKNAIIDNQDSFEKFFEVVKRIAPLVGNVLGKALSGIGTIASAVINIIGKAVDGIVALLNFAISGINTIIRGYNAIPGLPDIKQIGKIEVEAPKISAPTVPTVKASDFSVPASKAGSGGNVVNNNVTVNGAIDSESTARQIVKVLNEAASRGTGGGLGIFEARVAL